MEHFLEGYRHGAEFAKILGDKVGKANKAFALEGAIMSLEQLKNSLMTRATNEIDDRFRNKVEDRPEESGSV